MKKTSLKEPCVSLFWVFDVDGVSQLFNLALPLSSVKPYDGFYSHPGEHYALWDKITSFRPELKYYGYEDFPRGRVNYNANTKTFYIFADPRVLNNPDIMQAIREENHITSNHKVISSTDPHYRTRNVLKLKSVALDEVLSKLRKEF